MFVIRKGDVFIPPYSHPLRRTSDQLFESGISQMYEGITNGWRIKYEDRRLMPAHRNVSADGKSPSSDFSLDDPQGKITCYLDLIGCGFGIIVLWAEIAWNPIKLAGKYIRHHARSSSSRAWHATGLFIKSMLRVNANQEQHTRRSSDRVWYRTRLLINSLLRLNNNQNQETIRVQVGGIIQP